MNGLMHGTDYAKAEVFNQPGGSPAGHNPKPSELPGWHKNQIKMKTINEKSISVLNDLIEINKDGQQGFETAAKDSKDAALTRVFRDYEAQRSQNIRELQSRVRVLGGDPDKHGSVAGTVHRGWINLKAAIASNEPHAVLAEAERGEDAAVKAYREAQLKEGLDVDSLQLIQNQAAGVKAAHDRVKQLRDSHEYAKR